MGSPPLNSWLETEQKPQSPHHFDIITRSKGRIQNDLEIGGELNTLGHLKPPVRLDTVLIAQRRIGWLRPHERNPDPIAREIEDPLEHDTRAEHLFDVVKLPIVVSVAQENSISIADILTKTDQYSTAGRAGVGLLHGIQGDAELELSQ